VLCVTLAATKARALQVEDHLLALLYSLFKTFNKGFWRVRYSDNIAGPHFK